MVAPLKLETVERWVLGKGLVLVSATALLELALLNVFEAVTNGLGALRALQYLGVAATSSVFSLMLTVWLLWRGRTSRIKRGWLTAAEWLVSLPSRVLLLHVVVWSAVGLLSGLLMLLLEVLSIDGAFMLALAGTLAGLGGGLAGLFQTRKTLDPLWSRAIQHLDSTALKSPALRVPLRHQMTLILGGLVFFSSGLALYTAFAFQKQAVLQHAREVAGTLERSLERQASCGAIPPDCGEMLDHLPPGGGLQVTLEDSACRAGLSIPEGILAQHSPGQRGDPDPVTIPSLKMELVVSPVNGGVMAVLVPRQDWTRKTLLVLLAFFTLLFLYSAHLAARVSWGLTRPILALQAQVVRMEQGDLESPIESLSVDELGDLGRSTEGMRASLQTMVAQVRSLNLTLEQKVTDRTLALEVANSELNRTLRDLKDTQAQLVHAEKMVSLGRMLTGLAHELNNPVSAILNSATPLREKLESEVTQAIDPTQRQRLQKAAQVIERASQRTVALIQSLTTFGRQDEEARRLTEMSDLMDATLLLLQHRIDRMGTHVSREWHEAPPVACNPGEIGQVLMNLLANALDAVSARGNQGRLRISGRTASGFVEVEISDNGEGLPAEVIPRIFEPFYTTKANGTGLGLAISHQIVTRHGGELQVVSQPGAGATFVLRLPAAPLDPPVLG